MENEEKIVVDLEATDEIEEENTDSYKYKAPVITEETTAADLWEPAKEDEDGISLGGVWIPNRAQRRKMQHSRKKAMRDLGNLYADTEKAIRKYVKNDPQFRQDMYKALYEDLKKKAEEKEEEFKKEEENNNGRTDEGN